jgi:hypothetical protein
MKIQPETSDGFQTPSPLAHQLPPQILERATNGLILVSVIAAGTSIAGNAIDYVLHPGFAAAFQHPILRISLLSQVFLSAGFIALQRSGWLSKQRLLDLGMVFQVLVAFRWAMSEAAAYKDPDVIVFGLSRVALG